MTEFPSIKALYAGIHSRLAAGGVDLPDLEARWILSHALGVSDAAIIAGEPYSGHTDVIYQIVGRRLAGEPLSRIFGVREFRGLEFELSPETLDPRPDTETLVNSVLERFTGNPPGRILDIGTGTGCILISLLNEWRTTKGVATDLSEGALTTALRNAERHGVADRIEFVCTNWAEGIAGPFDVIVSNPPYIASDIIPNLATEVRNHDPILALDGGRDGLEAYKSIITEIKNLLVPGGRAFFEIGYDQAEDVARLVEDSGATPERIIRDLGGNPRVVECRVGISEKRLDTDS